MTCLFNTLSIEQQHVQYEILSTMNPAEQEAYISTFAAQSQMRIENERRAAEVKEKIATAKRLRAQLYQAAILIDSTKENHNTLMNQNYAFKNEYRRTSNASSSLTLSPSLEEDASSIISAQDKTKKCQLDNKDSFSVHSEETISSSLAELIPKAIPVLFDTKVPNETSPKVETKKSKKIGRKIKNIFK